MAQEDEKNGHINSLIFASSTGEDNKISCKLFLKGQYNAWNITVRKIASEKSDPKEYKQVYSFLEELKKQAGVESVNDLNGMKIKAIFKKDELVTFRMDV